MSSKLSRVLQRVPMSSSTQSLSTVCSRNFQHANQAFVAGTRTPGEVASATWLSSGFAASSTDIRAHLRLGRRHHRIVLRSEDVALLDHAQAEQPLLEVCAHSTPIENALPVSIKVHITHIFWRGWAWIRETGKINQFSLTPSESNIYGKQVRHAPTAQGHNRCTDIQLIRLLSFTIICDHGPTVSLPWGGDGMVPTGRNLTRPTQGPWSSGRREWYGPPALQGGENREVLPLPVEVAP